MSKLTDKLSERVCIYNPWGLCQRFGGTVYIDYRRQESGRAYRSAAWQVIGPGAPTDPTAMHIGDRQKTFPCYSDVRAEKPVKLAEAKAWADAYLGREVVWVRDPFGAWQESKVIAAMKAALNA